MSSDLNLKTNVAGFWNRASCGEVYAKGKNQQDYYDCHESARYHLEPYLLDFAKFEDGTDKDVLEVGVGMGADHLQWAASRPCSLTGIDLTPRAVEHTSARLAEQGFEAKVSAGDAEKLSFDDDSFDLVYSWGVIHHSPDTATAVREIHRVLRPGGTAKIMVYHTFSLVGYMLWLRYGLLAGRPFRSLKSIYAKHLESPGTKAYTVDEIRRMFGEFSEVDVRVQLSFGDLLEGEVGQRHRGVLLTMAKKLWPRWLLKKLFKNHGLYLLIQAKK